MSTTLTIRNLDETVKYKLRQLAALHQRSMEAEAREILARGVAEPSSTGDQELTPAERLRQGIESVRGMWGEGTTDDLMKELRGDD